MEPYLLPLVLRCRCCWFPLEVLRHARRPSGGDCIERARVGGGAS
jgi:hypothetical protein